MSKFTYDDIVRVLVKSAEDTVQARKAWVVAVYETEKETGSYWKQFAPGIVYSVEFEDGSSVRIHEDDLEMWE